MTRTQITLAVLAALFLLALRGCYDIVPVGSPSDPAYGAVFRLNRLTGAVYVCGVQVECFPVGHPPKAATPPVDISDLPVPPGRESKP
jgi:hypothetical protein